jgi:cytochrome c oxidase assembly protein subunit 15
MVAAAFAVVLAILGSWVRINGAGMTCPDWPLCHGLLVPSLRGGVVLEWTHRFIACIEGVILLLLGAIGLRLQNAIPGLKKGLIILASVFAVQVLLGGLTVHLANSPLSVVAHWGTAMLLIATLLGLALLKPHRSPEPELSPDFATPLLYAVALLAFVTMGLGSYVSSSYAGLACPAFPRCGASWLNASSAQLLQMLHRFAAGSLVLAALAVVPALATRSLRTRRFALLGLILLGLQIALGALNVIGQLPTGMREAHAANAVLTFLSFVIAALASSRDGARIPISRSTSERETNSRPITQTATQRL